MGWRSEPAYPLAEVNRLGWRRKRRAYAHAARRTPGTINLNADLTEVPGLGKWAHNYRSTGGFETVRCGLDSVLTREIG